MPSYLSSVDLLRWYKKSARDLPWRRTSDPYKIWISEIMLQQTTVNAVIPYYERWIKRFPFIQDVAKARLQTVLKNWQGLGYYQRARNIHKAAQIISREHNGKIPADAQILKSLPGFGPYTIGAVLSIAFKKPFAIVDANVRRVFMRQLAIEGKAEAGKDQRIYKILESILPARGVDQFNQALMELGALICRNKEPLCNVCPVQATCEAYRKGIQEIIPEVSKKSLKEVNVAIAVLKKGKEVLIQRRPATGLLAGLWEFPGGKVEKGEDPESAMIREVKEELGIEVRDQKYFMNTRHFYTQFKVNLEVWICAPARVVERQGEYKWVKINKLRDYPMPSGSAKIVDRLLTLK